MIDIRSFTKDDLIQLQQAINRDKFHPGLWTVEHFSDKSPKEVEVISDQTGPIAFVRFTKTLRISCVWNDAEDNHRNARAIIHGIRDAVIRARDSGFTEIIITAESDELKIFLSNVLKMNPQTNEFVLQV